MQVVSLICMSAVSLYIYLSVLSAVKVFIHHQNEPLFLPLDFKNKTKPGNAPELYLTGRQWMSACGLN